VGVIFAGSTLEQPLPPDTETRLASFTELVATAIANTESRAALARLAEEQAALRRVATLVARGAAPEEVFTAVAGEVGGLLRVDYTVLIRSDPEDMITVVGGWTAAGVALPSRVGSRFEVGGRNVSTLTLRTGRPARLDAYVDVTGSIGDTGAHGWGFRSSVGVPISVEGRPWGLILVAYTRDQQLPADTEVRLVSFTELVATAIANAESRSELAASRRRIVAASDQARRRIERDLHDGTQQRLVSLGLAVRTAEADVAAGRGDPRAELSRIAAALADAVAELQELSRGIHPAILSEGGLGPALRTLARRSAVPVDLDITTSARCPEPVEVAAYYVASEALSNAMKHAHASLVEISLATRDGSLLLSIRDDGIGGADPARGSGLAGLTDRVEALGGSIRVHSAAGAGTHITVDLPLEYELA
jgi:signal transduction histidine kinase